MARGSPRAGDRCSVVIQPKVTATQADRRSQACTSEGTTAGRTAVPGPAQAARSARSRSSRSRCRPSAGRSRTGSAALGRSSRGNAFKAPDLALPLVGQDQAAELGDADRVAVVSASRSGHREQVRAARALPVLEVPLHGGDLGRLVVSVLRPWRSPAIAWSGATMAAIHIAMENMRRSASSSRAAGARRRRRRR